MAPSTKIKSKSFWCTMKGIVAKMNLAPSLVWPVDGGKRLQTEDQLI